MTTAGRGSVDQTQEFLDAIDADQGVLCNRTFEGCIDLSGMTRERIRLRKVVFRQGFVADSARLILLSFEECSFGAPLKLRNSNVAGDVALKRCTFAAAASRSPHEPRSLDLRGATVDGSVEISGCTIGGACRFDRAVVRGNLQIHEESAVSGTTNFTRASIDSQLELSGSIFGEIVFSGS